MICVLIIISLNMVSILAGITGALGTVTSVGNSLMGLASGIGSTITNIENSASGSD